MQTSRGFSFITLVSKQDPCMPQLSEVKERVRDEVIKAEGA